MNIVEGVEALLNLLDILLELRICSVRLKRDRYS